MPGSSFGEVIRLIRSALDGSGLSGLSDAQLLERFFTERDERAFAVLVERHGPMVFSVCRRIMGDVHQSEDAFQAAFLVLIRKTTSLTGKKSVGDWLHGVARLVALRARAQSVLRRQKESEVAVMSSTGPLDQLTLQELRSVLDEEIASLSEKYQGPIVLCHLEGKTYDEAARELGCTKITLSRRLTKARALLRTKLERRGIALSLATLATALTEAAQAAPLPAFLALNTVKAATLMATGKTVAGGCLSAGALALAEEALTGMVLAKGKLVIMVMALGLAVSGAGWAGYKVVAETGQAGRGINAQALGQKKQAEVEKREEAAVRNDENGDPLPGEAISRLGTTRYWCGSLSDQIVYSSDGRKLLVSNMRHVVVLDARTGQQLRRIVPTEKSPIMSISLSPNGNLLAVGGEEFRLFDLTNGKVERELKNDGGDEFLHTRFSPDGSVLAAFLYRKKTIVLWSAATGQELRRIPISTYRGAFTFSQDGKTVIVGDGGTIRFLDVATDAENLRINGFLGVVYRMALSPDGKTLATHNLREEPAVHAPFREEKQITLWDTRTGKKLNEMELFAVSKKGGANNKPGLTHAVQFQFSPDGKELIVSSNDYSGSDGSDSDSGNVKGTLSIWDLETAKELRRFNVGGHINHFSCAPDGKYLATVGDGSVVRLWNSATGEEVREHPGHRHSFIERAMDISPNGRVLASGSFTEPDVRLWDLANGRQERRFTLETGEVLGLYYSSHGDNLITLGRDKKMVFWDAVTGKQQRKLQVPIEEQQINRHVLSQVLSQDRKMFASVDWNADVNNSNLKKIILWDATTGLKIKEVGKVGQVCALAFAPDAGSLYSWDFQRVYVWDVASGKLTKDFPAEGRSVYRGSFSPDGKWFVCGGRAGNILLYDMATGKEIRRVDISGELEAGPSFAYSPDGRTLSIGVDDGSIHLLELATGKLRYHFIGGHQAAVTALIFTPDGHRLISGSADTTGLVWDLTGRLKTKPAPLTPSDIVASWNDLKSDDAARAYQAIRRFAGVPGQTLPFLDKNLLPVAAPNGKAIATHLADLESEIFAKRNAAMNELTKLGELAEPALSLALDKAPTLETRNRIKQLLDRLPNIGTSGEPLRQARAVEVLENIGSPQARQLLEKLATGAQQANLTRDARATLERLRPS